MRHLDLNNKPLPLQRGPHIVLNLRLCYAMRAPRQPIIFVHPSLSRAHLAGAPRAPLKPIICLLAPPSPLSRFNLIPHLQALIQLQSHPSPSGLDPASNSSLTFRP